MRLLVFLLTALSWADIVLGRAAFAHFMVGNTENYSAADWTDDITLAQEAHIDAFALNMAKGEPMNEKAIASAFSHAEALGFKLFFSFDYAGRGPYSKAEVIGWITRYASSSAYFRHNGKPLVSTFEGPDQAEDWIDIKAQTGCFFVPDWSSLGAGPAVRAAGGVADGLFSWAGWPWGSQDMDTYVDASYMEALGDKPYMMPVSPWFYTNLPGYSKNWLWRGDHLWYDRWLQVNFLMPEWIQIISWNDYGESHHIGPIRDHALVAFDTGKAPYKYSLDHHGWRAFLPYSIDRYKNNKAAITKEGVSFWYRPTPKGACNSGGTTGNTVSQLQIEFQPTGMVEDSVFYTVLVTSEVTVKVTIGGVQTNGQWRDLPDSKVGLWHGSSPFNGRTGEVQITVWRKDVLIADLTGPAIKNDCHNGMTGFDAWAGGRLTSTVSRPINSPSLADEVCVRGTGAKGFDVLCQATCYWGYCPRSACVCQQMGAQRPLPKEVPGEVYPAEGLNSNYIGLCNYACLYGACYASYCGKDPHPLIEPTVSPFRPPSCISGTGQGEWEVLCGFTCRHGFCPIARCTCNAQGPLDLLNPTQATKAVSRTGDDHGLCGFACARGFCPSGICNSGNDPEQQTDPVDDFEIPHLDQDCTRFSDCVDLDNPQASSCGKGYRRQGYDKAGCSGNSARPICCKDSTVSPDSCTWRGSGGDCNGQCHQGEATLFESNRGGSPGESGDGQCSRGKKVFCCELKTFGTLTGQCRWSPCGSGCDEDETETASAYALSEYCSNDFLNKKVGQKFCCKTEVPPLDNCHWVGQGDCADNNCNNKEVTLRTNPSGANSNQCFWSRKKSLCCTPSDRFFEIASEDSFEDVLCTEKDTRPSCEVDEWDQQFISDEVEEEVCKTDEKTELRRSSHENSMPILWPLPIEERMNELDKRAKRDPMKVTFEGARIVISIAAMLHPSIGTLFRGSGRGGTPSNYVFRMVQRGIRPDVTSEHRTAAGQLSGRYEAEHNPDLQMMRDFTIFAIDGTLPRSEEIVNEARISAEAFHRVWNSDTTNIQFPTVGSRTCYANLNDYLMDRFGSTRYPRPLVATESKLNRCKGKIFKFNDPIENGRLREMIADAVTGDKAATDKLFGELRLVIGTFNYIRHPDLQPTLRQTRQELREAMTFIGQQYPSLRSLPDIYERFEPLWYARAASISREWLEERLNWIEREVDTRIAAGRRPPNATVILARVLLLRSRLSDMKGPPPL